MMTLTLLPGYLPSKITSYRKIPDLRNFNRDIVVIGFQEIVELNASSIIMGSQNHSNLTFWNNLILKNLSQFTGEEYVFVIAENLVGIHTVLFTKRGINQ